MWKCQRVIRARGKEGNRAKAETGRGLVREVKIECKGQVIGLPNNASVDGSMAQVLVICGLDEERNVDVGSDHNWIILGVTFNCVRSKSRWS